ERINKLSARSQPQWGQMNTAQMLAHLQQPIGVAEGTHKLTRTLFARIVGPMVKSMIYNDKPFKRNLPTDKSFVMTSYEKDFEKEKQNLVTMINNFKEENIVNELHPFFGKLSKEQWSKGTYKHLEHHLPQFGV
ncbi:MAG: DUF1569 domain-containing protein, partial [Ginsengibacter sp.]